MSIIKVAIIFLLICIPLAVVAGICGALIRINVEGHPNEELIVKGSMLVISGILVFITVKCLGG